MVKVNVISRQINPFINNTENKLQLATRGCSKKRGGLDKVELVPALLEAVEVLRVQGELNRIFCQCPPFNDLADVVNTLPGAVLRTMLKTVLSRLACDAFGKPPKTAVLPDTPKFVLYGLNRLSAGDQQFITDSAPVYMVFQNSAMAPLNVAGMSVEAIEKSFPSIEYFASGHLGHEHIGLTEYEYENSFENDFDRNGKHGDVSTLSRFVVNYAASGNSKCYITGANITKNALRISFGTPFGTRIITSHADAQTLLKALGGSWLVRESERV